MLVVACDVAEAVCALKTTSAGLVLLYVIPLNLIQFLELSFYVVSILVDGSLFLPRVHFLLV